MKLVRNVLQDLIEKKLWPVAVALVAGLVAVPVLLGGSSNAGTPAPAVAVVPPAGATGASAQDAVAHSAVVSVDEPTAGQVDRSGKVRNPFVQHHIPKVVDPNTVANTAVQTAKDLVSKLGAGSTPSSTGGASAGGAVPPVGTTTPAPTTGTGTGTPGTPKGSPRATYGVTIRFGEAGDQKTIKNVARLTPLPSSSNPFFVYLGLTDDGKSAVFMVDADAVATGDGTCMPNPDDCEQVKLKKGDIEFFEMQSGTAGVVQYQLNLVSISKAEAASKASAAKAHARESRAGRDYLREVVAENPDALAGWNFSADSGLLVHKDDVAHIPAEVVKAAEGEQASTAIPSFTAQP